MKGTERRLRRASRFRCLPPPLRPHSCARVTAGVRLGGGYVDPDPDMARFSEGILNKALGCRFVPSMSRLPQRRPHRDAVSSPPPHRHLPALNSPQPLAPRRKRILHQSPPDAAPAAAGDESRSTCQVGAHAALLRPAAQAGLNPCDRRDSDEGMRPAEAKRRCGPDARGGPTQEAARRGSRPRTQARASAGTGSGRRPRGG